ncbi:MAG: ornithine carbamoyltransferase [Elusimicrobiota bacterium]
MTKKDFLRVADYTKDEIKEIFDLTGKIKTRQKKGDPAKPLEGKTLGMIFQKSSTRTRVSFEVGMYQLGGYPLFLSANDLQLKRGETIADTAKVLSRMLDAIMIRTYAHSEVEELAKHATIPVINGLTDSHHPCQIMADIYTIMEHKKSVKGLTVAWVGDGNNVLHSWIEGAPLTGMNLRMAVPPGYEPDKDILKFGVELAKKEGTQMLLTNDPVEAVKGADVIYTDVWVSMGQDAEKEKKLRDFKGFQINGDLMKHADKDYVFMHCLPAHRGEEVSEEIIDGPHSIIFDEAENRMHVQKAILVAHMLRGKAVKI